jgi:hypothetical protein
VSTEEQIAQLFAELRPAIEQSNDTLVKELAQMVEKLLERIEDIGLNHFKE